MKEGLQFIKPEQALEQYKIDLIRKESERKDPLLLATQKAIEKCRSFEELDAVLTFMDKAEEMVAGTNDVYAPDYLKELVKQIREGSANLEQLTRSRGLRDKLESLLKTQK